MKKITFCLLLFIILTVFASCKPSDTSSTDNIDNTDNSVMGVVDGTIWSPGAKIQLVVGESPDWNSAEFIMELGDIIGVVPEYSLAAGPNQIVVGKIDHPLSALAYEKMESNFSGKENNAAFLIYSDGSSVAIAYDSEVARMEALEYFLEEYKQRFC